MPDKWPVYVREVAEADLRRLPKKVANSAKETIDSLEDDPYIGEPCDPPMPGARKTSFWSAGYRLVWLPDEEKREVNVLGARWKGRDSEFFKDMEARYAEYQEEQQDEADASQEKGEQGERGASPEDEDGT